MEYLFDHWQDFAGALSDTPHLLLLSDYDGTLTPIVGEPKDALIPPDVREKLRALAGKPGVSLGIISGRAMDELKRMVDVAGIFYAGNHGLEISGPGISFVSKEAETARATIRELAGRLAELLDNISGVIIEDKGLSLSVHYRLVSAGEVDTVLATFREVTAPLADASEIRITTGKKVMEARPPIEWHKGKAVEAIAREIMTLLKLDAVLTVYLGDDSTDEDAFKVLSPPAGWGIYVGGKNDSSAAGYYLKSTGETSAFLSRLLELK